MKILLTGANGQIGQEICTFSKQTSASLIACDRLALDITDQQAVLSAVDLYRPDMIINAAAYTSTDRAETERDKVFAANVTGPENLAKACKQFEIGLIHISTNYVFDGNSNKPYIETDATEPISVYGQSKMLGEEAVRSHLSEHIILRIGWVFGRFGNNFIKSLIQLMQQSEEIRMVADQFSCPTYSENIARAIFTIAEKPVWGTYHFSDQPSASRYDFTIAIFEEAKKAIPLQTQRILPVRKEEFPTPSKRPLNTVLDCEKFVTTYGLALRSWRQGVKETIHALKHNNYDN